MSQHDMILQQQIAVKRQERASAVIAAKAALRALSEVAFYARTKPVEEINTAEMTAHLEQLISRQEDVQRIDSEIKELEY